jgi:hypothetical protein
VKGETQFSLPFRKDAAVERVWDDVLHLIRLAVEAMGGVKELAYQVDASPSLVSDALREQDRKRVAAEWLVTLFARAPADAVLPILQRLAAIKGFEVRRRRVLTTEEKLERALEALRAFGRVGAEKAAEVDGE